MSKNQKTFFEQKQEWSKVKDRLLSNYLMPYLSKILKTGRDVLYVDAFAGAGRFNDPPEDGSPVIALKTMAKVLELKKYCCPKIEPCFIELQHYNELADNINGCYDSLLSQADKLYQVLRRPQIIPGRYPDDLQPLLHNRQQYNLFLYLDPFGIIDLNFSFFKQLDSKSFHTAELLLNFNSFGFIRYACKALKCENRLPSDYSLPDPTADAAGSTDRDIIKLNDIAGGTYWQNIIRDFKDGKIDCYKAESKFALDYCSHLKSQFVYVLNMPIRVDNHLPKYRMIFGSNHLAACLLMAQNISKCNDFWNSLQKPGLMPLFSSTPEGDYIAPQDLQTMLTDFLRAHGGRSDKNQFVANFFNRYGVICSIPDLDDHLKILEAAGQIFIERIPSVTKNGRPTTFMNENKDHKISLSCTGG